MVLRFVLALAANSFSKPAAPKGVVKDLVEAVLRAGLCAALARRLDFARRDAGFLRDFFAMSHFAFRIFSTKNLFNYTQKRHRNMCFKKHVQSITFRFCRSNGFFASHNSKLLQFVQCVNSFLRCTKNAKVDKFC